MGFLNFIPRPSYHKNGTQFIGKVWGNLIGMTYNIKIQVKNVMNGLDSKEEYFMLNSGIPNKQFCSDFKLNIQWPLFGLVFLINKIPQ